MVRTDEKALIRLDPEREKVLRALAPAIVDAESAIEKLESIGMNMTAIKDELKVAKVRRDFLLKHFGA